MISLDIVQMILWSITYVLVIVYNIKYKITAIPALTIATNFAWETVALLDDVFHGFPILNVFNLWFALDAVVVFTVFCFCRQTKKSSIVIPFVMALPILVFGFSFFEGGQLITCFTIDAVMEAAWMQYSLDKNLKVNALYLTICGFKLIGDLCAWLFYKYSGFVAAAGILVLALNIQCLVFALSRLNQGKEKNRRKKHVI